MKSISDATIPPPPPMLRVLYDYTTTQKEREKEREMRGEHPSFRVTHVHGLYVNFYLSDEYRKERMCPEERRRSETD